MPRPSRPLSTTRMKPAATGGATTRQRQASARASRELESLPENGPAELSGAEALADLSGTPITDERRTPDLHQTAIIEGWARALLLSVT